MTETTYTYLIGITFIFIFTDMAVCTYVAFYKLDKVESHFKNCKLVENNQRIWGGGFFGRSYRLSQIGGMLIYPKIIVKNGEANFEEIQKLPASLRRWVVFPLSAGVMLFFVLAIIWIYGKYNGWIE